MIDMRYKPYHLPQMGAPYTYVLEKLDEEGISYDVVDVHPEDLTVSQGITFNHDVAGVELSDTKPIYLDRENTVLDGHHRMVFGLINDLNIKAIKIHMNYKDACRVLNKIQDIYEYDKSHQTEELEEVEMQDTINYFQDDENQFLNNLEEDNSEIQGEKPSNNEQTVVGYRKLPINDNSVVGNFFSQKPIEGFQKYEIDFDNLLDTNVLGMTYKDGQEPVDILAKIWFPNINFEQLSEQYKIPPINLKNKAIAKKAMKLGFDGIKYGDTLIQGLK